MQGRMGEDGVGGVVVDLAYGAKQAFRDGFHGEGKNLLRKLMEAVDQDLIEIGKIGADPVAHDDGNSQLEGFDSLETKQARRDVESIHEDLEQRVWIGERAIGIDKGELIIPFKVDIGCQMEDELVD